MDSKNVYAEIYTRNYEVEQIYLTIPSSNFEGGNAYDRVVQEFIDDLTKKYGSPNVTPTGDGYEKNNEYGLFCWYNKFHLSNYGEPYIEGFHFYVWNLPSGEIRLIRNKKKVVVYLCVIYDKE